MLYFKRYFIIQWLCIAVFIFLIPSISEADVIFVGGDVSGVWSADSVIVSDSIFVSPGNTLEIEPGVHVVFLAAYSFRILSGAILHAVGNENDSISFLPAVQGYSTLGIDFHNASDSSIMEYCYISHALYSAITLRSTKMIIRHCLLENNPGYFAGGGITAMDSSGAIIEYNTIRNNDATNQGGGIQCYDSSPTIQGNIIDGNSTGAIGGAILCGNQSHPLIIDNTIINNDVFPSTFPPTNGQGGAIYCSDESSPTIIGNYFSNNRVNSGAEPGYNGGGAVFVFSANPVFENNIFDANVVEYGNGGAIYLFNSNSPMVNNVFVNNTANDYGGAVYIDLSAFPSIVNSILYDNYAANGSEIYLDNSDISVTYSDIEGGWEGTGNIDTDPLFRAPYEGNYHLMFTLCDDPYSSPCIDTGDPEIFDAQLSCETGLLTFRSDMGAYGGGGEPPEVAVFMIPDNQPVQVPAGSNFTYSGQLINSTGNQYTLNVALFVFSDELGLFGPLNTIRNIPVGPNDTLLATGITQHVPFYAPPGMYQFLATCSEPHTPPISMASFNFEVLPSQSGGADDWNSSDWFKEEIKEPLPEVTALSSNYPNPFNATTMIKFNLQEAGDVKLEIYNLIGQKVTILVNGDMDAGQHTVIWDAANYSSGVYFYKLSDGDIVLTKHMTLLK